jgi:Fe-S cluster assembly protein SufD
MQNLQATIFSGQYELLYYTKGLAKIYDTFSAQLSGASAQVKSTFVYDLVGDSHGNLTLDINHEKAETKSHVLVKTLLDHQARFSTTGKISMQPHAVLCEGQYLNKNFLLTPHAKANSRPQLDIAVDDVKCTHGCSSVHLSEEELFFLTSRGIPLDESKELLKQSFTHNEWQKISEHYQ